MEAVIFLRIFGPNKIKPERNEKIDHQEAHKQILDYCKQNIADYALPNRVIFVDEFPLTKMGKTDYVALEKAINT